MVPDPKLSAAENQKASADLASISAKLHWLLPDQSLSPFERLERLGRAVEDRTPDPSQLQPAAAKVEALKVRIDELIPGDMTHEKKIDILVEQIDRMVSAEQRTWPTINKLELLGDPRGRVAPERPTRRGPRK
jgi:hypothetical protein